MVVSSTGGYARQASPAAATAAAAQQPLTAEARGAKIGKPVLVLVAVSLVVMAATASHTQSQLVAVKGGGARRPPPGRLGTGVASRRTDNDDGSADEDAMTTAAPPKRQIRGRGVQRPAAGKKATTTAAPTKDDDASDEPAETTTAAPTTRKPVTKRPPRRRTPQPNAPPPETTAAPDEHAANSESASDGADSARETPAPPAILDAPTAAAGGGDDDEGAGGDPTRPPYPTPPGTFYHRPTAPPPGEAARLPQSVNEALKDHDWALRIARAVERAAMDPDAPEVIPVMIVPVFHETGEMEDMFRSVDAPVRLFAFSWNSNSDAVRIRLDILKPIPYGISISQFPDNAGFSGAVNAGIRAGERNARVLGRDPANDWYFIVNADSQFPPGNLEYFARTVNSVKSTHGLVYGPKQDHFAFVVTRLAVDTVGYFDEVFWPGYMEDIDYRWRVRLAGLKQKVTGVKMIHQRGGRGTQKKGWRWYQEMLRNAGTGFEYGWMKWGRFDRNHVERDVPPSGFRTPFNVPDFPLSLWVVDPGHRRCIRTGKGHFHVKSTTCWYNGSVLLPFLPEGTQLTPNLLRPGPSGGVP